MARSSIHIDAPPDAVFEVLADPRSYAYWVVGSREVRGADASWPAVGTSFDHTFGVGFLRVKDHTDVEEVVPNRHLKICANAEPFGAARVTLDLEPRDGGTEVTMIEDAADKKTAFVFLPLTHLLVRGRNAYALDRLKELAEGTTPMPAGDLPSREDARSGRGRPVKNPGRPEGRPTALRIAGAGLVAGVAGGLSMTVSSTLEMRMRGRPPSRVPAKALKRVLGRRRVRRIGEDRAVTISHMATSIGLGGVRALLGASGMSRGAGDAAFFAISTTPDVVVAPAFGAAPPPWRWSRADVAVTVLHHAVYAAATGAAFTRLSGLRRR